MKRTTVLLSLGLAVLAATPADAGDWNNGAGPIRDHGGMAGVPVPAPVPIMESFSWYVRGDVGVAFKSQGQAVIDTALGAHLTESYDSKEGMFHGSVGFGRYITNSVRFDFTGDARGSQKALSGTKSYTATTITPGPNVTLTHINPLTGATVVDYTGPSTQINTYSVERSDEARISNHTLLANLYYDFNRGGGINPYIGAGVGAVVHEGKYKYSQKAHCEYTTNSIGVPDGPQPCLLPDIPKAGHPSSANFGLAAAAMAGVTYEISPGILIDTGYRLMYQGGNTSIRAGGDLITGEARTDHEFRTGVRWNIW